jgi:hypothetical protein
MGAFVRENLIIGRAYSVAMDQLYQLWIVHCHDQGRQHAGSKMTFGRDLRTVVPGLGSARPRANGGRARLYTGIGLKRRLPDQAKSEGSSRPLGPALGQCGPLSPFEPAPREHPQNQA